MVRRGLAVLLMAIVVGGCTSEPVDASPSASALATPPPVATTAATATRITASPPVESPAGSAPAASHELPTVAPPQPTATLPAVGTDRAVQGTQIAAGPDGVLFAAIPRRAGSILVAFGPDGQLLPGWPVEVPQSTLCGYLLPAADGSVRVICDGTDLPVFDLSLSDERVHAYTLDARPVPGWPVRVPPVSAARLVGSDLVFVSDEGFTDTVTPGEPSHRARLIRLRPDGTRITGDLADLVEGCCGGWVVGPGDAAYAAGREGGGYIVPAPGNERTAVNALDAGGLRGGGWPATLGGVGSLPAFGEDGSVLIAVGSTDEPGVRVNQLDPRTGAVGARSPKLAYPSPDPFGVVDCFVPAPEAPVVGPDGSVFVWSGDRVHGLDASLARRAGWPYRLPTSLSVPGISQGGLDCFGAVPPAPDPQGGTVLLLTGSIIAVGPGGHVRPGWPVELRRPSAAFWGVSVGSDGMTYALAVEPETRTRWSATVLAIAIDGSIRYRTTILDR